MDQTISDNIEALLLSYIEGELTKEEAQSVSEWIEESPEHKQVYEQIRYLYFTTELMRINETVNTEKALAKVRSRINHRKQIPFYTYLKYAAVLIPPLLFLLLFVYEFKPDRAGMITIESLASMRTSITLPDSSMVVLNSNSKLIYPASFNGNERKVRLIGEAYFDVAKDPKRKFIVSTKNNTRIVVYGTKFNVDAYTEDSLLTTTLLSGKIGFQFTDAKGESKEIRMHPSEKLSFNCINSSIRLSQTTGQTETAWRSGKLIFNDTSLGEMLRILEKRFNVHFIIRDAKILENSYTGDFKNQNLEHILDYLKISSNINWKRRSPDSPNEIELY